MRRILYILAVLAILAVAASSAQAAPPVVKGTWVTGVGTDLGQPARRNRSLAGSRPPTSSNTPPKPTTATKGFVGAIEDPATGVSIGSGTVLQHIGGLEPDTAYRFRAVATNNHGVDRRRDPRASRTDEAEPVFALPDDRGWEMVSPVDKNGGEIQSFGGNLGGGVLQAAAQGGQITYTSASSFANPHGLAGARTSTSRPEATRPGAPRTSPCRCSRAPIPRRPTSGVPYQLFSSDLSGALARNGRRCRTSVRDPVPGRKPAPAGLRRPGGLPQLLPARRLRAPSKRCSRAPTSPPRARRRGLRSRPSPAPPPTSPTWSSPPAPRSPPDATEVPGSEGECDPAKQNLYMKSGSTLKLINLLPALHRHPRRDPRRPEPGDLHRRLPRLLDRRRPTSTCATATQTKQVDAAQGEADLPDRQPRRLASPSSPRAATSTATSPRPVPPPTSPRRRRCKGVLGASEDGTYVYYRRPPPASSSARNGVVTPIAPQVDPDSYPPTTGNARVSADGRRLALRLLRPN